MNTAKLLAEAPERAELDRNAVALSREIKHAIQDRAPLNRDIIKDAISTMNQAEARQVSGFVLLQYWLAQWKKARKEMQHA